MEPFRQDVVRHSGTLACMGVTLVWHSKDCVYFRSDVPDSIDVQSHLKDRIEELVESLHLAVPCGRIRY